MEPIEYFLILIDLSVHLFHAFIKHTSAFELRYTFLIHTFTDSNICISMYFYYSIRISKAHLCPSSEYTYYHYSLKFLSRVYNVHAQTFGCSSLAGLQVPAWRIPLSRAGLGVACCPVGRVLTVIISLTLPIQMSIHDELLELLLNVGV